MTKAPAIITPHTRNAGYLLSNENLPLGNGRKEGDVQCCPHCEGVIIMQDWKAVGGFCRNCMKPIHSHCTKSCTPARKLIEEAVNRAERRRQYQRIVGV